MRCRYRHRHKGEGGERVHAAASLSCHHEVGEGETLDCVSNLKFFLRLQPSVSLELEPPPHPRQLTLQRHHHCTHQQKEYPALNLASPGYLPKAKIFTHVAVILTNITKV